MPRIVQITDSHLPGDPERREWANLARVLDHVRARLEPVDLLVMTGDLANRGRRATYERLRNELGEWLGRLRVLPGNHDEREALRAVFGDRCFPGRPTLNFSQPVGEFACVGLDTLRQGRVHGRLGDDQLAWLAAELRRAAPAPAMLFLHHPPVRVGTWWLDKDLIRDRAHLEDAFRSGVVRAIAAGHVHQEAERCFAGATVWTTPSTAYQFPPRSLFPRVASRAPALRVIDLDGQAIRTKVERLD